MPITHYTQGRHVSQRIASRAREVLPFGSRGSVTYPELIGLADSMYCSVGGAREAMLRASPDAEVPEPTPNVEDLTPLFEIGSALVNDTWRAKEPVGWGLTARAIVEGVFDSGRSLALPLATASTPPANDLHPPNPRSTAAVGPAVAGIAVATIGAGWCIA